MIYGYWPQWRSLEIATAFSFALLLYAYYDFKKAEPQFADRL